MVFVSFGIVYILGAIIVAGTVPIGGMVRKLDEDHFGLALALVASFNYDHKINMIKAHRQVTGLGLKESKDMVELAMDLYNNHQKRAEEYLQGRREDAIIAQTAKRAA